MAITIDAPSSVAAFASSVTVTWSHTVGSGANRLLSVSVGFWNGGSTGASHVSSVTYGGAALARVANQTTTNNGDAAEVWRIKNPVSGTANIVITFDAAADGDAGAVSLDGVDQTTSEGTPSNAQASSTAPTTSPAGGVAGDLAVDAMAWDGSTGATATMTANANRTSVFNGHQSGAEGGAGSYFTSPANPQAMAWTLSVSSGWAIAAIVYKQAAGGPADPFPLGRVRRPRSGLIAR